MFWNQIWFRSIDMNAGTQVNGHAVNRTYDIGARRLRMIATAQLSERFLILAHFGANNQSFINGGAAGTSGTGSNGVGKKPGIFFHDVTSEYAVIPRINPDTDRVNPFSLYLGGGLHSYMGISRISMVSTTNLLTLDSPIFSFPLVEQSDQFVRIYGMYLKGNAGKIEYRLSLNKPFSTNLQPVTDNVAVDNNGLNKLSVGGYFEYQFFDRESNTLPFKVGSYLGTKKVMNIGAGFYQQSDGTISKQNDLIKSHPISLKALDFFLDLPVGSPAKKQSVTSYTGLYRYDFGPNYLRNMGTMNIGSFDERYQGTPALAGPGNALPMIGTGTILYNQSGFLLPDFSGNDKVRLQPFAGYARKNLQALEKSGNYWDFGANLLINNHHAKISAQYSLRPHYLSSSFIDGYKGQFILQFQTYL